MYYVDIFSSCLYSFMGKYALTAGLNLLFAIIDSYILSIFVLFILPFMFLLFSVKCTYWFICLGKFSLILKALSCLSNRHWYVKAYKTLVWATVHNHQDIEEEKDLISVFHSHLFWGIALLQTSITQILVLPRTWDVPPTTNILDNTSGSLVSESF